MLGNNQFMGGGGWTFNVRVVVNRSRVYVPNELELTAGVRFSTSSGVV